MDDNWTRESVDELELKDALVIPNEPIIGTTKEFPDEIETGAELGPPIQHIVNLDVRDDVPTTIGADLQPQDQITVDIEPLPNDDPNDEAATVAELPSQHVAELEDSSSDRDDTIVQFRNEVKRLSFRKTSVRHRPTGRRPLRDIVTAREETGRSNRESSSSLLQCYKEHKDLYWPKIRRRIIKILSYKLWEGHLKVIEGEFGNGPVSYFVFVRFLLLTNLAIFLIWFAFVCIPQIAWRYSDGENIISQPSLSELHCLRQCTNTVTCPPGSIMREHVYECIQSNETDSVVIDLCANEKCDSDDRPKLGSASVTVCNSRSPGAIRYCVFDNVDPEVGIIQWALDFVTGQGYFNRTGLFYGQYYNGTVGGYNMPLAYLSTTAVVYGMFLIMLVYRMGQEYNEDYIKFSNRNDFSNKLFSAWDYHVTNKNVAHLKHKAMKKHFEDEVSCRRERTTQRNFKEWFIILIIRFFVNLFVFLCLAGAGCGIYFTIRLSLERTTTGLLTFETLITSIVVSFINLFLPPLFSFLAELERYKTTTGKITVILIRSVIVRLMPIVVLIAGWLGNINCTQPMESDGCSSEFRVSARSRSGDCPRCWETFIGQEAYRLALVNLVIVNGAVIALETGLNLLSKINWHRMKCLFPFLKEDENASWTFGIHKH